jgi:hypothetical protein
METSRYPFAAENRFEKNVFPEYGSPHMMNKVGLITIGLIHEGFP